MKTNDYQVLDLAPFRNGGVELLAGAALTADPPPTGDQLFHGLPFAIGSGSSAYIAFGAGLAAQPVSIPIHRVKDGAGQSTFTVVFAHRLLESTLMTGGPLCNVVAEYVFRLTDVNGVATECRVPIRERFEIAEPMPWGNLPFLALPDQKNGKPPRWEGQWSNAGTRQTEVIQGAPRAYFVWSWRNPHPDRTLVSIDVVPHGQRFIIAGITLGHVDEHPFVRDGALPVRIDITDPEIAQRAFDVGVTVDRGVATYPFPLPDATPAEFVADGLTGWGEPQNEKNNSSYANIAATPSATVEISANNESVESVCWGDVLDNGVVETPRARVALIEEGRNWVETTVVDDDTGQPIPCRVHFRSIHGVPYQPHGHHDHVNSNNGTWHVDVGGDLRLGQISYAYIDGVCQGWLPRGEMIAEVVRGYEYQPIRQRITIEPGQQRLELRLKRWTNMNEQRWFSGDTHVHFLSTVGSYREARGEDLNIVNLLPAQWGSLFTNTEEFTGEPYQSPDGRTIVWVSQENRQHMLGHMSLLGLRKPVYPWSSDGPGEAELGSTLDVTMADWADQTHAQGGLVILPHFPSPNGEPAALVATGRIDGVEMIRHSEFNHIEYYRYLNSGYKLPLVGGTDKMSSGVAVGQYRTYVYVPPDAEFTYEAWCQNLKKGRTFLSGGPMIELSIDGAIIGDTVRLPTGGGTVEVSASASATMPIHTLQIIQNGRVIAQTDAPTGSKSLAIRERVRIDGHGWICARVSGPNFQPILHNDIWSRGVFAHTSPIYIACGGDWEMADAAGLHYMLTLVDGMVEYIRETAPRYKPGTVTHHHGEIDHRAYLERPFTEAREALHRRMHRHGIPH